MTARKDGVCGESWDHDLETTHDDDEVWQAECRECGAEIWEDKNDD